MVLVPICFYFILNSVWTRNKIKGVTIRIRGLVKKFEEFEMTHVFGTPKQLPSQLSHPDPVPDFKT